MKARSGKPVTASRGASRSWNWWAVLRQVVAFAVLAGLMFLMFQVTSTNLQERGVRTGFDFLSRPAVTPVLTSPLEFELGVSTAARALAAGALNTLKLTAATIVLSTLVGLLVGLGSLAHNPLARRVCTVYVEAMRNVPVLLHIVFWYGLVLSLPPLSAVRDAEFILASNRGIFLFPTVQGFSVHALVSMTPEFAALFLGISLYTAAFIAEIVRSAVGSIPTGQWEACKALGLSRRTTLVRVVGPQAVRVGLPALASEYLGVFKNSSLALVIGYQDFMAVGDTMLTDTGHAIEIMALVMLFYGVIGLCMSAVMHWFERRQHVWSRT